ncbi:unnamed protein product [Adineta ricciae]|uniref:RanBP2-type domain-containing protein n=2 Tax=Adineta ricciae TaxID=249248 RepID=A0A814BVS5_ADIRI|nr:unnamed protein product [Adineta ricciae]
MIGGLLCHQACLKKNMDTPTQVYNPNEVRNPLSSSESIVHTIQIDENHWKCKDCSTQNVNSTRRCRGCGKTRSNQNTSGSSAWNTTLNEEEYGCTSTPGAPKSSERYPSAKSDKKGTYDDDDDDDDVQYESKSSSGKNSNPQHHQDKILAEGKKHRKPVSYEDDDSDDSEPKVASSKRLYPELPQDEKPIKEKKTSKPSHHSDDDDEDRSTAKSKKPIPSTGKKSGKTRSPSPSTSKQWATVYITDLPVHIQSNSKMEALISKRIEDMLQSKPKEVKCYSKLGIGFICVANNELKNRLLNTFGRIVLDPKDGKSYIVFVEDIEIISYMVLEVTKEEENQMLPTATDISRRWVELHKGERPVSCDVLSAQFPNIYRVTSSSLEELTNSTLDGAFRMNKFLGHIYYCADCCFFDDLPRTITKQHIHDAIAMKIKQPSLSQASLYIQVNKRSDSVCVISADEARSWSAESFITIDKTTLQKKTNLPCRLVIHPIPESYSIQNIIKHRQFQNAVTSHKLVGDRLILEVSDKNVFDQCLDRGALRLDSGNVLSIDLCNSLNNPDGSDIDEETWYRADMLQMKPDIMQFLNNLKHKIFRLRWNAQLWSEQFERVAKQKHDPNNPTSDQIRHLLRVTVMLNTLAVMQKRSFMIKDREIQLRLKNQLETIVYNHKSTIEKTGKLPLKKMPYSRTKIRVVRNDCLIEYENMVKKGKRPVLLNMASATSPGGGFRKGDGAQEENIFRRSDYCRSLDVGLDDFLRERADRFYCSSDCRLDRVSDPNSMYPMDEYGAIYTTGITVFRQPEETGYAFMEKPLEDVCSIAMAAYRDPELKGNFLAPKYAVGTRKKIENIFAIAHHHKHDCLILSAFGCGAFKNPPEHVAKLFHSVIEQYAGLFDTIVFAIVDDHNAGRQLNPDGNFKPFAHVLDDQYVEPPASIDKPDTIIGPYLLLSDGVAVADVKIFHQTPCNHGPKCVEMYDSHHNNQFSHPPLCIQAAIDGKCKRTDDVIHMTSFVHRNQCRDGGLCKKVNDESHSREFEHPNYCPEEGRCQNQEGVHLKQYRHLPLCEKGLKCMEYQREIASHCNKCRHCAPQCSHGGLCAMFHDREHVEEFKHPFASPCPRTPFDCPHFIALSEANNTRGLSHSIQEHCIKYAHVCRKGRYCTDNTSLHLSKTIHVARNECSSGDRCKRLADEEHLNSFSHPNVPDVRPACQYGDKCREQHKFEHKVSCRHPSTSAGGVVQYYGSNEDTDFVQNQKRNVQAVEGFVSGNSWKPLSSGSIPHEILHWVRTVKPIHRCSPLIFESIFLHGHVMSREYMEHLKDPAFVANSVLHHTRIRRIEELKECEDDARLYVTALVALEFENKGFHAGTGVPIDLFKTDAGKDVSGYSNKQIYEYAIKKKEARLIHLIQKKDLAVLREKAIEIAQASIELHSTPAGIGHPPDKALGTDKQVFSVLGPNFGHYYGDVIIVFKREILHHPDANYSMQAATMFPSGNVYKLRPWLGPDSGDVTERIKHYHRTKLHASIPGYEYATALELIALISHQKRSKKMDISLDEIFDQWLQNDAHHNIEAHLPQLIPLDYIDHIYIPKNLFAALSEKTKQAIDALFKHHITLVPHDGVANHERGPFGPNPRIPSRSKYQDFVAKKLIEEYKDNDIHSSTHSVEGAVITVPSSAFDDHYLLPLTISQAFAQYRIEKAHHTSKDNITYIYWKAMHGDMMLTLSNEQISNDENQPNLRCLICYIAPKPAISDDDDYHEEISYLAAAHPFKHVMILSKRSYKAKSNTFYRGCNGQDFMTFCLQIHRSTGKVILSHAGPNGIYNHEEISCTFNRSELDLNKMEYIHVSAGSHSEAVRNLIVCFEKQPSMHSTFDKDYERDFAPATENKPRKEHSDTDHRKPNKDPRDVSAKASAKDEPEEEGLITRAINFFKGSSNSGTKLCSDNVNCLKQYSTDGREHNAKFVHPCPFSEKCRDKDSHTTHTHEPHDAPRCSYDRDCKKLNDPYHRAAYRHTGRPDFLQPCRYQKGCRDKTYDHRMKYSHGEEVFTKSSSSSSAAAAAAPSKEESEKHESHDHSEQTPCRDGRSCRDISTDHRKRFSHPSTTTANRVGNKSKTPCKFGVKCHNFDTDHRADYSHPDKS